MPASNFSTPDCIKINKALSVRVIVICRDYNFYGRTLKKIKVLVASTLLESILHTMIIIIILEISIL